MKYVYLTFELLFFKTEVIKAMGAIHKALASLTVVATLRAIAPYFIPAPTTELVSWMASAAHNPNCSCDNPTV